MSKKPSTQGNYDVGYKKPPRKTRFKKGKSGNPKGRPKRSRNTVTLLNEELDQPISIQENGKTITVTKREAIIKRMVHSALNADHKAIATVLNIDANREEINPNEFVVTDIDKANFERLTQQIRSAKAPTTRKKKKVKRHD